MGSRIHTFTRRIALLNKLYGKEKYRILFLAVLGFINGIVASIGIGALVPLFSFVAHAVNPSEDRVSRYIFNGFRYVHMEPTALKLLLLVCILFIAKAIVTSVFGYISLKVALDYELDTKSELYRRTLYSNWQYLSRQKIGYLENTLMTDVTSAKNMFRRISSVILQSTSFIMYLAIAFAISSFITAITLGMGLLMLLAILPLARRTKRFSKECSLIKKEIAHQINENIIGIKTVKVSSVENEVSNVVKRFFEKLKAIGLRIYFVRNIPEDSLETISLVFISIVFGLSYTRPGFSFAAFLVVIYLIQKIFTYVIQTQVLLHDASEAMPYLKRLIMMDEEISRFEEKKQGGGAFSFARDIEMKETKFSYDDGVPVLNGISFTVPKGQMLGIIGPSGAGKTTIVDLLLRLFDPQEGSVLLDGKDARTIELSQWRKHIGYVSQDIFLKNDTIRSNIAFYNDAVTDKDIIKAAQTAYCHDLIMNLPDRLDTIVGERGLRLSGGERQRIVLARVLAQKPSVLILDEATSALDNESELAIRNALKAIKGELTIIVIAHRLSTVADADSLLVIENGSIIERGAPKELLEDETSYFHRAYTTGMIS